MCGLLVAAKVQERVAVAGDGLPAVLLVESFQLGEVLHDDGRGHLAGAHGRQRFVEFLRQADVGKLIENEAHRNGQAAVVDVIRAVVQFLYDLRVQHADEVGERRVVIRDDGEDRHLLFAQLAEIHIVMIGDDAHLLQVERCKAHSKGDQDGFGSLAGGLLVHPVLLDRDMLGLVLLQLVEQQVEGRDVVLVVLLDLGKREHGHDHAEVLLGLRRFVQKVEHQRLKERGLSLFPERVGASGCLGRGVSDEIRDELQHVLVVADISERTVAVRLREVHKVEYLHLVALLLQQEADVLEDLGLRVGDDIAAVAFHDAGQGQASGLAGARAAEDKDVQVAPVPVGIDADADMLCQRKADLLGDLRVQLLRRAPFRGAVLLALAEVGLRAVIDQRTHAVEQQKNADALGTAFAPADGEGRFDRSGDAAHHLRQIPAETGRNDERRPDHGNQKDRPENDALFGGLIWLHRQPPGDWI